MYYYQHGLHTQRTQRVECTGTLSESYSKTAWVGVHTRRQPMLPTTNVSLSQ